MCPLCLQNFVFLYYKMYQKPFDRLENVAKFSILLYHSDKDSLGFRPVNLFRGFSENSLQSLGISGQASCDNGCRGSMGMELKCIS